VIRRALVAEVLRGRAPKTMTTTLSPLYFRSTAHIAVRVLRRVSEEMLEGECLCFPIVLVDVVGANGRAIDLTRLFKTIFDFSNYFAHSRWGRDRQWLGRRCLLGRRSRRGPRDSNPADRGSAMLSYNRQGRHPGPDVRNTTVNLTLDFATGREDNDRILLGAPKEVAPSIHDQPADRENSWRLRENRCLQTA
jgi:hypothetical protein